MEISKIGLAALNVDEGGLDEMDNKILDAIINKFKGNEIGKCWEIVKTLQLAGVECEVFEISTWLKQLFDVGSDSDDLYLVEA